MAKGDHIRVRRFGYWHHGIDCGDGTVIHYSGEPFKRKGSAVMRTPYTEFARGRVVEVVEHAGAFHPDYVLNRAMDRLGEDTYCVFRNNCEHFARWCKTGVKESRQVRSKTSIAATVVFFLAVLLLFRRIPKPLRRFI